MGCRARLGSSGQGAARNAAGSCHSTGVRVPVLEVAAGQGGLQLSRSSAAVGKRLRGPSRRGLRPGGP